MQEAWLTAGEQQEQVTAEVLPWDPDQLCGHDHSKAFLGLSLTPVHMMLYSTCQLYNSNILPTTANTPRG